MSKHSKVKVHLFDFVSGSFYYFTLILANGTTYCFPVIYTVIITFDGTAIARVTTDSKGTFSATFTVTSASLSDHTVMASQVVISNTIRALQTFTVTTLPFNPTSNPVHTSPAFIQGSGIIDVADVRFGGSLSTNNFSSNRYTTIF